MMKAAFIIAGAIALAIAAALIAIPQPKAHADSPTVRAPQASDAPSQALRRYTLQLLHILSNSNKWEGYRQAIPHCETAPTYLDEIATASDVSSLDRALIALTEDLCADLDMRLDQARTVGLLLNEPEAMSGYALMTGSADNDVHLIDHLGRVVHSWEFENKIPHARLLDNGNLLVAHGSVVNHSAILEIDPYGNVVWRYAHPDTLHHDFLKMPNGNVLMIAQGSKTMEESIALGVNPDIVSSDGINYDYLIEVRPTGTEGGEIVWQWSSLDYLAQDFDPSKETYRIIAEHPELIDANFSAGKWWYSVNVLHWTWINGIDYNSELDQIALSARHYSELWIIDHSVTTEEAPTLAGGNAGKGGALLYRWGNPRAYRHGTLADQRLFRQHHTQWIAPGLPGAGNILVFNNGYELRGEPPYYSSIEEIVPPVDGYGYKRSAGAAYPPAEPIWRYTAEPPIDFYSRIMSGAQRLSNGNTFICESMSGNVFQVTPDGKVVWMYVYPIDGDTPLKQGKEPSISSVISRGDTIYNNSVYRAYWYASDHPGLQKYDLTPGDAIERYE